ncbi:hypothetical protein RvY_15429 [Ramazzottius varieornatus]|uniref:Uncharacterized protein n=1 Tax=Ramazzottius varieornatus TaxID=947166 RepID=A0A1D1W1Q3_RAMVA|nr:hypothetical protein RvY_15429 [Ramazzottius varieornatus]
MAKINNDNPSSSFAYFDTYKAQVGKRKHDFTKILKRIDTCNTSRNPLRNLQWDICLTVS